MAKIPDPIPADMGFDTPCLIWQGGISRQGYGRKRDGYAHVGAHRVSWEKHYGKIPEGFVVDHLCNVRLCQNTTHMRLCRQSENARRGFSRAAGRHPGIKATVEQAHEIKRLWKSGLTQKELGRRYGLTQAGVSYIVNTT